MEESKIYMELMKKVEKNKYKLIQRLIKEAENLSKINPDYSPFYARDCFLKVSNEMLEGKENRQE
jgi:hypothetical protein